MADNVTITSVSGNVAVATDDIASVHYQRQKIGWGPDGTFNDTDTASGKPLPMQLRESNGADVAIAGKLGATNESAAGTDTATSGLNGLVKRLLQHLTTLIGYGGAVGAAAPTSGSLTGISVSGNLRGATGLGVGSHYAQSIAVVDASGNQITTFGGTAGAVSTHHRVTTGSDSVSVKASAGSLRAVRVYSKAATAIYVKFHNTAGTPTPGSGVVYTVAVQSGIPRDVVLAGGGRSFATGIGMTVVTGIGDGNTTAVANEDAIIEVEYE